MKIPPKMAFWVTNASPRNVTLADLALNIKAFTTVNLLDKKHYAYTLERLIRSKESGSIYNKRDKIKVRQVAPPEVKKEAIPLQREAAIPSRERSTLVIKEENYPELQIADENEAKAIQDKMDEDFARESAELESGEVIPPKVGQR